ncbi:MAG: DoxX family protein, partial [Pseudolabrys sp.]
PAPGFLKAFVDIGFTPPAPWFWTALFTETLAGIALILGLFTRFFAAAAAIPLLIITAIYWHHGFSWLRQGYEYTLLWGWICFAIALRGGPYSVDRAIGKDCRLMSAFGGKADIGAASNVSILAATIPCSSGA